jgi:formylglycine-generating enzyme required for sulfatase activity
MGGGNALGRIALGGLAALVSCKSDLPPLPEALVVVDTNLPVPLVASRLRVDFYKADGTWFDHADLARPTPQEWPASFSVYSTDESRAQKVYVRLRVYPEGQEVAYQGERFRDWDAPFANPAGDGNPRLVENGLDVTPTTEPPHLIAVDRLLLLELLPSTRGRVRVLLDGACAGTMSYLGPDGTPSADATTCVDTAKTRVPVAVTPLESDMTRPTTTAAGTWSKDACTDADAQDGRVCIDGGGTLFGTSGLSDFTVGVNNTISPEPARTFALSKFLIDKDEVTVARFRDAVARGYKGFYPGTNDGPLKTSVSSTSDTGACTYTDHPMGREDYAVNCEAWTDARTFCQFEGGDLPTEVQWEHVATVAGRSVKTRYPLGDAVPTCDQTVYGRISGLMTQVSCLMTGAGPQPYAASKNDVTPLGVVAMGGDFHEWVLDAALPYTDNCWRDASLVDPKCTPSGTKSRPIRGASWASEPARGTFRFFNDQTAQGAAVGFRCAYPAPSASSAATASGK